MRSFWIAVDYILVAVAAGATTFCLFWTAGCDRVVRPAPTPPPRVAAYAAKSQDPASDQWVVQWIYEFGDSAYAPQIETWYTCESEEEADLIVDVCDTVDPYTMHLGNDDPPRTLLDLHALDCEQCRNLSSDTRLCSRGFRLYALGCSMPEVVRRIQKGLKEPMQ